MSGNKFSLILPVLFYEYLALSITKSLIPTILLKEFGGWTYLVVGCMETIKGLLAFVSCPVFGRLSDLVGRKLCLLVTVIGSTLPICLLVFTSNVYAYVIATAISGLFSATFPLTFAYIADCVEPKQRAPAYGLALATFGLSFCIGPVSGSYLAAHLGPGAVFVAALILVVVDATYIIAVLPETVAAAQGRGLRSAGSAALLHLPDSWSVRDTFRIFRKDPFLRSLAVVVFLYYTAVWALISTLVVFVTRYLSFTPVQLGALMSAYGLATMVSEALLVRWAVPLLGEVRCMCVGLLAFAMQCVVVAFAGSPSAIAGSVLLSMLANLVYPSVSALVSRVVSEKEQGEALGALNGIKAITEGFGPLVFGSLMGLFERSPLPGASYLLGTHCALLALLHCLDLPAEGQGGRGYQDSSREGSLEKATNKRPGKGQESSHESQNIEEVKTGSAPSSDESIDMII